MKKFLRFAAIAALAICFFSGKAISQPLTTFDADTELVKRMTGKYVDRYYNGFRKDPEVYFAKFSKEDLLELIESNKTADSIFIGFGTFPKKYEEVELRKKPTIIFQFRPKDLYHNNKNVTYKIARDICPPPPTGCKFFPNQFPDL